MYKWFLNRGPNCATQNHNTQGRPSGHLRSHPTQSPRARDTHPLDQRSQLTVEPPDGLGGAVIINAEVFRDRVHGNATSAHLSRIRSNPPVHRHRGRPDEVHLDGQPGQGANVFLPGPKIQPKSGVFSHLTSRRERCETPSRTPVRGGPEPHRQPRRGSASPGNSTGGCPTRRPKRAGRRLLDSVPNHHHAETRYHDPRDHQAKGSAMRC